MESIFVSEPDAIELTTTSAVTLEQFCVYGLLKYKEENGLRLYLLSDLVTLFHLEQSVVDSIINRLSRAYKDNQQVSQDALYDHITCDDNHASTRITITSDNEAIGRSASGDSLLLKENRSLVEQIEVLRQERDWLRRRLENAESRIERDQVLLLSKSETIRQIVCEKNKKNYLWEVVQAIFKPLDGLIGKQPTIGHSLALEKQEKKQDQQ